MPIDTSNLDNATTRDQVNQAMRKSPEWRQAIQAMGHDPDGPLKLTGDEQKRLAQQMGLNSNDFHIDGAGNINEHHGWSGLPTWAKVAIIAGGTVATAGALGAFGGAAAAGEGLASGGGAVGAMGGSAALGTGAGVAGATGGGLGTIGALASGASTLSKIGSLAGAAGKGIGDASTAAGQNRLDQEKLGLEANAQNISGQSAFENELLNRAKEESTQRTGARQDLGRASYAAHPFQSPFAPTRPGYSDAYMKGMSDLEKQAGTRLSTGPQYDTTKMPALSPYKPIAPGDVQGATNTKPGKLEQIGKWVGPGLSIADAIAQYWG